MNYAFAQHEAPLREWKQTGFPGISERGKEFLRHLDTGLPTPLWNHQKEAIQRCIYAFEVLGMKDVLTNIVTGGGKTVIIGALVAYMMQVHGVRQHLIVVPNTIVRARLFDGFKAGGSGYVFSQFPFFFGADDDKGKRLDVYILEAGKGPEGIRAANVIIGNVHQLYEGKDNWRVVAANCDSLCIYNDEAHNTRAEQYNELINRLKPKRFFRLDTTATPDRLDGLHPDSEMIYVYDIAKAMHEKVIKRVVVFEPEIEKVKFTYYDFETKQEIAAEEMPWEEIERGRIKAVRYAMNPGPMAQQIGIALECLRHQRRTVPIAEDGRPSYKPLLFIVALNISDAEKIAETLREQRIGDDPLNVLLIHNEVEDEQKGEAMAINKDIRNCKYDAIVSVMMLREGWDVKNISVILLFRKFCFTEMGDRKFSVYGPQVIGRGLRRISSDPGKWEQCHVVDHPIFKHDWLWEMLAADKYGAPLNPGAVIDERKIPPPKEQKDLDLAAAVPASMEEFDLSDLPPVPEPEVLEPITDWRAYLDDCQYDFRGVRIDQKITQVLSQNLDSGHDTLDGSEVPRIDPASLASGAPADAGELKQKLLKRVRELARTALLEYDSEADARQETILRVIHEHIARRFTGGTRLHDIDNQRTLNLVWHVFDQVKANFYNPRLIGSILLQPPTENEHAEPAGHAFGSS